MRHEMALRRRLHTLHTLHDAVAAMRSLSAHHFRVLRQALPAARDYRTEIESVVAAIGLYQPRHGLDTWRTRGGGVGPWAVRRL